MHPRLVVIAALLAVPVAACSTDDSTSRPADAKSGEVPSSTSTQPADARQTDCEVVEFRGRTYRLSRLPDGTGPGVGRILGEGRTSQCPVGAGGTTTVYSVNEMDPDESVTISDDGVVAVYVSDLAE